MMRETTRLVLRALQIEDAEALHVISANPEVALNTGAIPHPYPTDGAKDFIFASLRLGTAANRYGIFLKLNGSLIGTVACQLTDHPSELTYMIDPQQWGKGFAREASESVLTRYFNESNHDVVYGSAMLTNAGSRRVLQKIGFQEVDVKPVFLPARGRDVDVSFWQLTRPAWLARKG